jgi:hypothetical protein
LAFIPRQISKENPGTFWCASKRSFAPALVDGAMADQSGATRGRHAGLELPILKSEHSQIGIQKRDKIAEKSEATTAWQRNSGGVLVIKIH